MREQEERTIGRRDSGLFTRQSLLRSGPTDVTGDLQHRS